MSRIFRVLAIAAVCAAVTVPAPVVSAAAATWFVLRNQASSTCWIGKLVVIGGQYARGSALIAGGPYASEAEAETRLAALRDAGTCNPD